MKKLLKISVCLVIVSSLMLHLIPNKAPDVNLNFMDGKKVNISSYRGNPLLVTFWSITCSSCLKEIPRLTELYNELNPYGFEIVGIAMSYDPPNRVIELSEKRKIPYSIALDINSDAEKAFGSIRATPTSFLIDPSGKIIQHNVGTMNIKKLRSKIKRLLQT
jgi:peroxiredoxin